MANKARASSVVLPPSIHSSEDSEVTNAKLPSESTGAAVAVTPSVAAVSTLTSSAFIPGKTASEQPPDAVKRAADLPTSDLGQHTGDSTSSHAENASAASLPGGIPTKADAPAPRIDVASAPTASILGAGAPSVKDAPKLTGCASQNGVDQPAAVALTREIATSADTMAAVGPSTLSVVQGSCGVISNLQGFDNPAPIAVQAAASQTSKAHSVAPVSPPDQYRTMSDILSSGED